MSGAFDRILKPTMTHGGPLTQTLGKTRLSGFGSRPGPPARSNEFPPLRAEPEDRLEVAREFEKKGLPWGKIALGFGSGIAAIGAAFSPAGSAFIQEHHLAQCVGLPDPVDLLDLSIETPVPAGVPTQASSARQNADWWDSLSPARQQELVREAPGSIGNLDGLPTPVRDQANRARLRAEISSLTAIQQRLQSEVDGQGEELPYTKLPGMKLEAVSERLTDLKRIDTALEAGEDRYLMVLDNIGGEKLHAAISAGNPDQAAHIAVTVPGVNTSVRSLRRMMEEGLEVRDVAQRQLDEIGRGDESIATVAWAAYDSPQFEGNFCEKVSGGLDSIGRAKAREGAEELNEFLIGLDAARTSSEDPNITVVGHSYGSLTTSLALQNGGHSVDNFVVYGSPGLALEDYSKLGIEPGHAFEMTAKGDKVPELAGKLEWFGQPTKDDPDFVHMSTEPATIEGVEYEGVYGHSDYPRNGNNGRVRISGYNVASVVAGLPGNAVTTG